MIDSLKGNTILEDSIDSLHDPILAFINTMVYTYQLHLQLSFIFKTLVELLMPQLENKFFFHFLNTTTLNNITEIKFYN